MNYSHNQPHQIIKIQLKLIESLKIIRQYDWLLDSYVLDFFIDNHWHKMPSSWLNLFNQIQPEDLSTLLLEPSDPPEKTKIVWPLSVLAIQILLRKLNIPRDCEEFKKVVSEQKDHLPDNNKQNVKYYDRYPKLKTVLTNKRIKQKKRHEIERMSQLTARVADDMNVKFIIDFGSGLGHLARSLTYEYALRVCCLEQQTALTEQARNLDFEFEKVASKYIPNDEIDSFKRPVHLNICLSRQSDCQDLVQKIMDAFEIPIEFRDNFSFGIIGLHPCGDLASILMNLFLNCSQAKFINLVGCCYMKLSAVSISNPLHTVIDSNGNKFVGYPLSNYLQYENPSDRATLSYEAKEIACHAIETYTKRLRLNNYEYLRVHSYRAAIEKIICKYWPEMKHSGLKSIKKLSSFREYCRDAVINLGIQIPESEIDAVDTVENLNKWKNVVIFYTLRLMFAPLVESVILYDRMLFLLENGCNITIRAIFDPEISSRNHILTALKS